MQESIPLPHAKPAPFVPANVIAAYSQRPPRQKRNNKKNRQCVEMMRRLDNLALIHDNYLASGRQRPAPITPLWMLSAMPAKAAGQGRGRPSKVIMNTLRPYIQDLRSPMDALALPGMDDITSGAVALDLEGNTRPLNKKSIIKLLQRLDVITAKAVSEEMKCGLRHAQKVATCLGIIVTLGKRWSSNWPTPVAGGDEDASVWRTEKPVFG